jgi:uncharacterized protein (UPF0179 family)
MTEILTGRDIFEKLQRELASAAIEYKIGGVKFEDKVLKCVLIQADVSAVEIVLTDVVSDLSSRLENSVGWEFEVNQVGSSSIQFKIEWYWKDSRTHKVKKVASGIPFSAPDEEKGTEPIEVAQLFVRKEIETISGKGLAKKPVEDFTTYVVWFAYILGGWKALVSTTIADGQYYEVTYNKEADEHYVDTYLKIVNTKYTNKEN